MSVVFRRDCSEVQPEPKFESPILRFPHLNTICGGCTCFATERRSGY